MATAPAHGGDAVRLRRLEKPEEFRGLEELERAAFELSDESPTPLPIQRAIQDQGGLVLGAFADVYLVGFSIGFLGWDGEKLYHYSHRTAVRPEYRNHRVGFRLKSFQRDEVLKQGLSQIRWVIDPLQSRSAMLTLRRLGARLNGYKVHYLGQRSNGLDRGLETDRATVVWEISDKSVEERIAGRYPTAGDDEARHRRSSAIVTTAVGDTGLRVPIEVAEPTGGWAHLEIPFDLALVRDHAPDTLRTWRHATRDGFRAAFDLGYDVEDFATVSLEHERRSFYLLRKAEPPIAPAPGAPRAVMKIE